MTFLHSHVKFSLILEFSLKSCSISRNWLLKIQADKIDWICNYRIERRFSGTNESKENQGEFKAEVSKD